MDGIVMEKKDVIIEAPVMQVRINVTEDKDGSQCENVRQLPSSSIGE